MSTGAALLAWMAVAAGRAAGWKARQLAVRRLDAGIRRRDNQHGMSTLVLLHFLCRNSGPVSQRLPPAGPQCHGSGRLD